VLDLLLLLFFVAVCLALMACYPVALTLSGVSLMFAGLGNAIGVFDLA